MRQRAIAGETHRRRGARGARRSASGALAPRDQVSKAKPSHTMACGLRQFGCRRSRGDWLTGGIVLLTDSIHPAVMEVIASRAEVRIAPATDAATLVAAAKDADVIVVRSPLPPELFERAKRLRGVIRHGAGIDMIPVEATSRSGVAVANAPGTNAVSVAEYAVGQMLGLSRRLRQIDSALRVQGWSVARRLGDRAFDLAGRMVGVLGVGAVGEAVARICHFGLQMQVVGHRPSPRPMPDFVRRVSIEELFTAADAVVLSCPLNDETRGLVDARLLGCMKRSALLINVSRGAVVDEAAMIAALTEGRIGGAALDVFAKQPLAPDSPLLRLPNVILSAHMAGITEDSMRRMGEAVARQVFQLLDGCLPTHFINDEARARVQARLEALSHP
jgi:D-3-phosphoglycerate dehydrogenase / 2-oxoglutarate reductase